MSAKDSLSLEKQKQ